MSVFDDPRGKLRWLEDELLEEDGGFSEEDDGEEEEEYEEDFTPRIRRGKKMPKAVFADERTLRDEDAVFVEKKKRKVKGLRRLKFLAFLEFITILAVLWWWIKWLY